MRSLPRWSFLLCTLIFLQGLSSLSVHAQGKLKKAHIGIPATSVAFLPLWAAYHKGFFRDEGIDLEIVLMSTPVANTALLTGDIDYHGGVAALTEAVIRGAPGKVIIFTADRPLQVLITAKEIKEPSQLKGKKIAGGPAAGLAMLLAERVVRSFGLDPKQDVTILPVGLADGERLAALRAGVVDAMVVGVPVNIRATEMGYNELAFLGDIIQFPQNGFGTSDKKIRESPDEILRTVRATLRGLMFLADKNNHDEILDIVMRQWKIADRRIASESFRHVRRFLTTDASAKPEEIKFLIDLARTNLKVSRQVAIEEVVDYSFVERARKELGLVR